MSRNYKGKTVTGKEIYIQIYLKLNLSPGFVTILEEKLRMYLLIK